jgi:hypothetical protein
MLHRVLAATALALFVCIPGQSAPTEPFAFADFSWLNGNSRHKYNLIETKYFTGQFQADTNYVHSFNNPVDHTIDGSCETGRHGEIQVQQLGVGGDFHFENVRGRLMTQFGMYSQMTPRNDPSTARGQWNLADAYRYISEAYGGYHFDVLHGLNIDVGVFMSYVGLFSYYNFENWAYQPSYVSANTPWFFNGIRAQLFPNEKLKLELWVLNGWQSYGMYNEHPGLGFQVLYRPTGALSFVSNGYYGYDSSTAYTSTTGSAMPSRMRVHSDNSVQVKYHDNQSTAVSKAALSFTLDAGCESGAGVSCAGGADPAQYFVGFMIYNRLWFFEDKFAMTVGGGAISNPGRYLVVTPPINGATTATGGNYFTANPGDPFNAWDTTLTFDYLPSQFITFRFEVNHRQADVPYFVGHGGITPPGGNQGASGSVVTTPAGWQPDLVKSETRLNLAMMARF